MSGKTGVGSTKYPATSDLQSGYFFISFVGFFVSQGENWPLTTYCLVKFLLFWFILSSEMLTLLGKTAITMADNNDWRCGHTSQSYHCDFTILSCCMSSLTDIRFF